MSHGATQLVKNSPALSSASWKFSRLSFTMAKPSTPPAVRLHTTIRINLGRAFRFSCLTASLLSLIVFLLL